MKTATMTAHARAVDSEVILRVVELPVVPGPRITQVKMSASKALSLAEELIHAARLALEEGGS